MKRKVWALVLALALALSLTGSAFAAGPCIEVSSPEELAEALAPKAGILSLRKSTAPVRVLLLADAADDFCGAKRVIHYADLGMFVLEFDREADALAAVGFFGADRCWLDTPETGARVLDGSNDVDPEEPATQPTAPVSGYTARSWGAAEMGLEQFRNDRAAMAHLSDRHVTVAVLDTGADMTVPLFAERPFSKESYDFVNATSALTDISAGAAAGHGTMIASLLCDLLPEQAELMVLRVFDNTGAASRTMILNALEYARTHGADIINMSLGWERADSTYTFLNDMLDRLQAQGVPVICAAGNRGENADTCYPASYETTVSVSAVNSTLNFESFSNFGSSIDFAAPGSGLKMITLGGAEKIDRGTSFAAPHVTALAADMLLCKDLSPAQLYQTLKENSEDLGYEGRDVNYGWGFPRITEFVKTAVGHTWGEWAETKPATEDAEGEETRTCVCGAAETRVTPKLPPQPPVNPFSDVDSKDYYFAPVLWAVNSSPQITNGTTPTTFSPNASCTRAQMVTFLCRARGCPQPKTAQSPFDDVQDPEAYYYNAVLWAVENEITTGMDRTHFAPDSTVTRAQTVTFLWRLAGKSAAQAENPFADVAESSYYFAPVLWAVENNITTGMDKTHFAPDDPCTRGQIVTFLYRYLG